MKCAIKLVEQCPPYLEYVAALPREIKSPNSVKITCTVFLLRLFYQCLYYYIIIKILHYYHHRYHYPYHHFIITI